ncbi:MAG: hypothetical protein JJ900_00375 [Rhodospirillales bacterium]|nr:hypothetical protein [Rhodospirillales bacterium]MBO6785271.1 hypothetical protein [Rhodospirillales bacterium]
MPLSYAFDPDLRVVCFLYGGTFDVASALDAFRDFAAAHEGAGPLKFLNIFDRRADLSELKPDLLRALKDELRDILGAHGIVRERTAFVLDGSIEVRLIGPLWEGINAADPDTRFPMRFFDTLEDVPAFFDCDPAPLQALVRQVRTQG